MPLHPDDHKDEIFFFLSVLIIFVFLNTHCLNYARTCACGHVHTSEGALRATGGSELSIVAARIKL